MISPSEIPELIDAYLDGDLSVEAIAELKAWLEADEAHIGTFAEQVFLHQQLREAIVADNAANCLQTTGEGQAASMPLTFNGPNAEGGFWTSFPARLLGVLAIVAVTGAIAFQLGRNASVAGRDDAPKLNASAPDLRASPVAKLVNVTNCRWDKALTTADFNNGGLQPGQSLHLLEGVAEIDSALPSGGRGTFQLEGPLAMILTSEGMPSLLYGRLAGVFTNDYDQFTLDTPLGRVIVPGDASIGVVAAANEVEVHAFSGEAIFESWSNGSLGVGEPLKAAVGASIRVKLLGDGKLSIHRGNAHEDWFVTPTAIAASQLLISDKYVAAIRQARPIGYWRFESIDDGFVRNEISDRLHCRVEGDAVRLRNGLGGNHTGEFGLTSGPGYLLSDDTVDDLIGESYTVEAWIKPTYYHHGALFSLIEWQAGESPQNRHRVHLELCGPVSGYGAETRPSDQHPGRIRFMNRNMQQCFSSSPYLLRKWQHLAAVRDKTEIRLYANGEAVGEVKSMNSPLVTGLRVLMGQLYPRNPHVKDEVTSRLFVGEMDEIALYNRALSKAEIESHVNFVQSEDK